MRHGVYCVQSLVKKRNKVMTGLVDEGNTAVQTLVNVAASSQVTYNFTYSFGILGRLVTVCVHYSFNAHYRVQRSNKSRKLTR